jgi:two-component system chemotaxis response regulator CheB
MPVPVQLVAVGASAGGVEALSVFVAGLPPDLPASVLVVLHVGRDAPTVLDRILTRHGHLPAEPAVDGAELLPGHVYVGVPDCHTLFEDGRVRLDHGPRENGHRPAVDPLMRSLAPLGERVAGVILSGARDDGTAGLRAIKQAGGWALVQDPAEASAPSMPASAAAGVAVDAVLPVAALAGAVTELAVHGRLPDPESRDMTDESPSPPNGVSAVPATPSTTFACPDCGGVLIEDPDGGAPTFRCQVGHRYGIESLVGMHGEKVEEALWTAVRSLTERARMLERVAERMSGTSHARTLEQAQECIHKADTIRAAIPALRADMAIAS